ncbi:MAG: hypothetical protein CK425_02190 [Parachlamydia sp.]|nr:MAG: hypothetical protein CK425_02190 [Parachlamydia sp.]
MKNLRKIFFTGITLLSVSSMVQAFEYTDRPPGSVSPSTTSTSPSTNPPGTPSTNPPGKGSVSEPSENSIQQNQIRQNTMSNPPHSSNYHPNSHRNVISEADAAVKTHNGAIVDDDIVQKVKWAIKNDPSFSSHGKSIQVSVKNGEVTLSGTVKDTAERQKIEAAVKQIEGVKSINNKLSSANK